MINRLICFELIKNLDTNPYIFILLYLYSKKYNDRILLNKLKRLTNSWMCYRTEILQYFYDIGIYDKFFLDFNKVIDLKLFSPISQEDIIRRYSGKIELNEISKQKFSDKVDWENISLFQKLSEDFIRKFSDKVHWRNISRCQELSEDFIREFGDKVDWDNIFMYQNLSDDFIREFYDKINWGMVLIGILFPDIIIS